MLLTFNTSAATTMGSTLSVASSINIGDDSYIGSSTAPQSIQITSAGDVHVKNNLIASSIKSDFMLAQYNSATKLYNNGYISDLSSTAYSHYSFLGSLLWAFFWKISIFEYEYFGRVFFLAIY